MFVFFFFFLVAGINLIINWRNLKNLAMSSAQFSVSKSLQKNESYWEKKKKKKN